MIRKAVPADIEKIAQIYADAYSEIHQKESSLDFLIPEISQDLKENEFRIAEVDGKVAGVIIYYTYQGYDEPTAYLKFLGILEEFRRNGIGKSLINTMESECRTKGIKKILLDVNSKSSKARALYNSLGYAENGMIQMEKELTGGDSSSQ
ncbi:MAG TPA: GNAT family N-acetyltransferase [Candidatus Omnitrophota bacterium]|nr:GNAT family N-acetyltransferase [Candidatus Omnitrophota bacterium]